MQHTRYTGKGKTNVSNPTNGTQPNVENSTMLTFPDNICVEETEKSVSKRKITSIPKDMSDEILNILCEKYTFIVEKWAETF